MKKHYIILLIITISFCSIVKAQLGAKHFLPPLKQQANNQGISQQAIYLSTPSVFNASVIVGPSVSGISLVKASN